MKGVCEAGSRASEMTFKARRSLRIFRVEIGEEGELKAFEEFKRSRRFKRLKMARIDEGFGLRYKNLVASTLVTLS